MEDSSWRAALRRDTTRARETALRRRPPTIPLAPQERPLNPVPYLGDAFRGYGVKVTPPAMHRLRFTVRCLHEEKMVRPIFKKIRDVGGWKTGMELYEVLCLYCLKFLTIKQVAAELGRSVKVTSRMVKMAFGLLIEDATTRVLHDQLVLIAVGVREPVITRTEIHQIMAKSGKDVPLYG